LAFCHNDGLAIVDRKPLNLFFRLRPQSRWRRLVDRIGDDPAIGFNRRKMEADELVPLATHCLLGRVPAAINERATAAARVPSKLAYSVGEVSKLVGISRSAIYLALRAKELRAVKCGRKMLVLARDLNEWLEKLPTKT
jgi:excisionase family DNA binding protein